MNRPALLLISAILGAPALIWSQAPSTADPASLKFEVASLKPSAGGNLGGIRPAPGGERYVANNASLRLMLMVAYRLKRDQIIGGPGWADTDTYDMNAKAERPSSVDDLHTMLKNLLTERFSLKLHRETRESSVYAMTVDKNGPKLEPHQADNAGQPWIDQTESKPFHPTMTAKFVTMDYFAFRLSQVLDRPAIDRTGLKGGYDFVLNYTRELPPNIPAGASLNGQPIDVSGPNIFEAMRQQLGLRLDAQKGPVEILVIDHAEKPAAN